MSADDGARLVFYLLLLVVIGGAMIVELGGRGGRMLRQAALWAVIFAGAFLAAETWLTEPRQQLVSGGRIEVRAGRDGHFHLTAQVNDVPIRFIVDTGASYIALGPRDARAAGIDPDNLAYTGTAVTANGRVRTARVTIDRFSIGDIEERNVPAMVIDADLEGSLLGMSYLRRFARISLEGDVLILER